PRAGPGGAWQRQAVGLARRAVRAGGGAGAGIRRPAARGVRAQVREPGMNNIDTIGPRLLAAKEKIAQAQREYDEVLAEWLEQAPTRSEGAVKSDGNAYRITTTYGVTRSVDGAALSAAWDALPEGIRNVFPVKHGLDLRELRHWQNNNPAEYARYIAPVITAKPAKPQVKVERMVERMDAAREAA